MRRETLYILGFSTAICGVCSVLVAGAAVGLKELQEENAVIDRQKKVLVVTGLLKEGQAATKEQVRELFTANIKPEVVDLATGNPVEGVDATTYDQRKAAKNPITSREVPPNPAQVGRVPNHALVYRLLKDGKTDAL